MDERDGHGASRRDFLKIASVSAPAAVATATLTASEAEAAQPATGDARVQDTAHTRAYFDSARF